TADLLMAIASQRPGELEMVTQALLYPPARSGQAALLRVPLLRSRPLPRGIAAWTTTASDRILRSSAMPGIRFDEVRATVTMDEDLGLVGFVPSETSGDQCGPCPVHHSASPSGRSFSYNKCLYT